MPLGSSAAPPVRAGTMKASASSAAGTTLLWPLNCQPSPARLAVVAT